MAAVQPGVLAPGPDVTKKQTNHSFSLRRFHAAPLFVSTLQLISSLFKEDNRIYFPFGDTTSHLMGKSEGKSIPVQAWTDTEASRRLRLPDFKTIGK
jgi:hypothetical protein